ncbi:trypsin-like peptidase domain-containing protein [Candidatus Saccharibacteria bacterium]|nr:trypsin-like peptidase domain-containing protein [Candidatus Saccharibacteria bacterium]
MQPQQPYITPQSPMQPAPVKRKRGLSTYLNWGMIAFASIAVIAAIAWAVMYFMGITTSDTGKTQAGVAGVLVATDAAPQSRVIHSTLGIQIPYDARELEGFGFAEEVTFSSTDLNEERPYTIMRVRPVETSEATRNEVTLSSPELRVTSSLSKSYWDALATKKEYSDLSKIDMLVKETVAAHEKDKLVESSDAEVKNINSIDYRKVTFTYKSETYGVMTERREDCYMTVQSDRPYVACINNIRDSNFAVVPQLEYVLSNVKYEGLDAAVLMDAKDAAKDAAMLENKGDEEAVANKSESEKVNKDPQGQKLLAGSSVPSYISSTQDFKLMASMTPSVVRIGTVYCADIKLTLPNGGDGPTLTGACVDKAGTGFFVSRDGLVATEGSVVQVKPQEAVSAYITNAPNASQVVNRLQRILDYLVESRSIMQTDADALMAGVEERNQDIIAKVNALSTLIAPEDIAITKEKYAYAVQLSDKPIVVNENGDGSSSFAYTDTVVEAAIEAKDYSTNVTQQQIFAGESVGSDAALLKVGKSGLYPALQLGASGGNIADKSTVRMAGLPMYAFGSLASAQFRETPLYRSGTVAQTFNSSKGQKVRSIATSSHAGLAGAPAIDDAGRVIGMATYNNLNCPDRKCFASTVIRDTAGISELVKQRNITLQSSSDSTKTWNKAIGELANGNYRQATQSFNTAASLYPQNYLAAQFAAYSKSQYSTATDTSTMNTIVSLLQVLLAVCAGLFVLLAIAKIALRLFVKPRTETQYGQLAQGQYIDPTQWQHQASVQQTQPPQTLAPFSNLPQPTSWQQSQQSTYANPTPMAQPPTQQPEPQTQPPSQYPPAQ